MNLQQTLLIYFVYPSVTIDRYWPSQMEEHELNAVFCSKFVTLEPVELRCRLLSSTQNLLCIKLLLNNVILFNKSFSITIFNC